MNINGPGTVEILGVEGKNQVGGNYFDERMVEHLIEKIEKTSKFQLNDDYYAVSKLREAWEEVKIALSTNDHYILDISSFIESIKGEIKITRMEFEEKCEDLFQSTLEPLKRLFQLKKIEKNSVENVFFVGGSSFIPRLRSIFSHFLNGKKLNYSFSPFEFPVCGASIQGAILSGRNHLLLQDILLLDTTTFAIGIETAENVMTKFFRKHSTYPIKFEQIFNVFEDKQTTITIQIFEGDSEDTRGNIFLDKFEFGNIKEIDSKEKILVTLLLDQNYVLKVTAKEISTNRTKEYIVGGNSVLPSDNNSSLKKVL